MSVRQDNAHLATLGPRRSVVLVEGFAALVGLIALSAAFFGLLTWAVVQLVRMLAG